MSLGTAGANVRLICAGFRLLSIAALLIAGDVIAIGQPSFTSYPIPVGTPGAIVTGPDRNLWFTGGGFSVGRITTAGVVTIFPTLSCCTNWITSGPDGNLWFTESGSSSGNIGRMTTTGTVVEFPLPLVTPSDPPQQPNEIAA